MGLKTTAATFSRQSNSLPTLSSPCQESCLASQLFTVFSENCGKESVDLKSQDVWQPLLMLLLSSFRCPFAQDLCFCHYSRWTLRYKKNVPRPSNPSSRDSKPLFKRWPTPLLPSSSESSSWAQSVTGQKSPDWWISLLMLKCDIRQLSSSFFSGRSTFDLARTPPRVSTLLYHRCWSS